MDNLIKALRCLASNNPEGDCYEEQYNFGRKGQRISCYGSPETMKCPYNQDTYGVCFEDGDCCEWLNDTAELLQELQQYRQIGTLEECREEREKRDEYIKQAIQNCFMIHKHEHPGMEEGMCAGLRTLHGNGEPCEVCKECALLYLDDYME